MVRFLTRHVTRRWRGGKRPRIACQLWVVGFLVLLSDLGVGFEAEEVE
jgi:hypothetical protein